LIHSLSRTRAGRLAAALALLLASGSGCRPAEPAARCVEASPTSLIAVGDTGVPPRWPMTWYGTQLAVARAMDAEHRRHPVRALVLPGDNFYPAGPLREEAARRIRENLVAPYCRFLDLSGPRSAEVAAGCRVAPSARRPVPVVAVLGNHDHMSDESPALERELVPAFLPGWRMAPGEVAIEEIEGGLSLVHFDSTPLLYHDPTELSDAIGRARGPWRILVGHHPLVGSGWDWDVHYRDRVLGAIRDAGVDVHLLLAGHDHNLQVGVAPAPELPLQVVAGSGASDRNPRIDLLGRSFVLRAPGFVRVDGAGEGLVVSVFSTAERPIQRWRAPRLEACYRVEANGRAHPLDPIGADGGRPAAQRIRAQISTRAPTGQTYQAKRWKAWLRRSRTKSHSAARPDTSAVAPPTTSSFHAPFATDPSSGICRTTAPTMAGSDIMNENSAAAAGATPSARAVETVAPLRDTPGTMATAWAMPIHSASAQPGSSPEARGNVQRVL